MRAQSYIVFGMAVLGMFALAGMPFTHFGYAVWSLTPYIGVGAIGIGVGAISRRK